MAEGLIYKQIPLIMAEIGSVAKLHKNETQKYAFRSIEDLYLAAQPAMAKHGVFCAPQAVERVEYRFERTNDYGKTTTWVHVALKVVHRFYATDGSFVEVTTWGEGLDNSDKSSYKCLSGAMKYALIELFCVPTEDIADADRTTPEAGVKRVPAAPVTLVPIPPGKLPEQSVGETCGTGIPGTQNSPAPVVDAYITTDQQAYLARKFREAIRPEKQTEAEEARHAALGALSLSGLFKSRFVDDNGNPTSKLILTSEYTSIGRALVKAAKSL